MKTNHTAEPFTRPAEEEEPGKSVVLPLRFLDLTDDPRADTLDTERRAFRAEYHFTRKGARGIGIVSITNDGELIVAIAIEPSQKEIDDALGTDDEREKLTLQELADKLDKVTSARVYYVPLEELAHQAVHDMTGTVCLDVAKAGWLHKVDGVFVGAEG
jgi:uncharacterized protein YbjT (DUF2867 family)